MPVAAERERRRVPTGAQRAMAGGVPIALDASPGNPEGNTAVKLAPHTLYGDPTTNQVCVRFQGVANVIFVE